MVRGTTRSALPNQKVYPPTESGAPADVDRRGREPGFGRARGALRLPAHARDHRRRARCGSRPTWISITARSTQFGQPTRAVGVHSHGYVARTDQQALDESWPHYEAMHAKIGSERGWPPMSREQYEAGAGPEGALFVGSPETVAAKIVATVEGARAVALRHEVQRRHAAARAADDEHRAVRARGHPARARATRRVTTRSEPASRPLLYCRDGTRTSHRGLRVERRHARARRDARSAGGRRRGRGVARLTVMDHVWQIGGSGRRRIRCSRRTRRSGTSRPSPARAPARTRDRRGLPRARSAREDGRRRSTCSRAVARASASARPGTRRSRAASACRSRRRASASSGWRRRCGSASRCGATTRGRSRAEHYQLDAHAQLAAERSAGRTRRC